MTSRWARVARGGLVASVAISVAAFSHVAGGGAAPSSAGLALAGAFALLACIALAGRRLTLPRVALSVVLSQLVFHLLFALGGASAVSLSQAGHHGAVTVGITHAGTTHGDIHTGHAGAGMWIAHAVAALVTIGYLRRGEREVWRLASTAVHQVVGLFRGRAIVLAVTTDGLAVRVASQSRRPVRDDLGAVLSALRHRGPPARILSL